MEKASIDKFKNLTGIKPIDFENYFGKEKVLPSTLIIPRAAITKNNVIPESILQPKADNNLSDVDNPLIPEMKLSKDALKEINLLKSTPSPITDSTPEPEEDDSNQRFLARLLGQGVAMFGAGIAGRDPMQVAEQFNEQQFYSDRLAQSKENEKYNRAQRDAAIEQAKLLMDPKSKESERARLIYEQSLKIKIPSNFSASDLKDRDVLQGLIAQSQPKPVLGRGGGVAQPKEAKPKEEKERKLSQDERQLLNNSALAYKALFDMEKAISNKVSRRSFMGDNPYTYAANRFVEGIGRMQSGGAIGTEEAENFKRLIPGVYDDDEISKQKIQDMKLELESRLKSIGYDPKQILESRTYSENEISPSEQEQAIKWANENINSKDETTRLKAEKILRGR